MDKQNRTKRILVAPPWHVHTGMRKRIRPPLSLTHTTNVVHLGFTSPLIPTLIGQDQRITIPASRAGASPRLKNKNTRAHTKLHKHLHTLCVGPLASASVCVCKCLHTNCVSSTIELKFPRHPQIVS